MIKNNFRILKKKYAYLQTILKTPVKFQMDWPKTVGGVADTRMVVGADGRTEGRTDGRTDRQTDGRTDGRTDTQNFGGYNIIPRHFLVAGHKNLKNLDTPKNCRNYPKIRNKVALPWCNDLLIMKPGPVAWSDAHPPGMRFTVRSSGPTTFFRGDCSWNHFYGNSLPTADSSRAVVSYQRKDVHLVLVNSLVSLPRNSVDMLTDRLNIIVVDWDVKPQIKQTKQNYY